MYKFHSDSTLPFPSGRIVYTNNEFIYFIEDMSVKNKFLSGGVGILTLNYLQIEFSLSTKQIFSLSGLSPEELWDKKDLKEPSFTESTPILVEGDFKNNTGIGYSLTEKFITTYLDTTKELFYIGKEKPKNVNCYEFISNVILSLDENHEFEGLYIKL